MISPTSITHLHLLAALNTDSQELRKFRVLDVGCGTGKMLAYFAEAFKALRPDTAVELFGMDVKSVGFDNAVDFFPVADNIKVISADSHWPYPDGFFDFVISNQVVEHVSNAPFFFSQIKRVLREGGVSYHLFPLRNCLWEGHVLAPLAHQVIDHDSQVRWINRMQKLGFSKGRDPEDAADSLLYYTHYRSRAELLDIVKASGLRPSFRHTPEFFAAKLRSMLKTEPKYLYNGHRTGWLMSTALSYASSITLRAEKKNIHR